MNEYLAECKSFVSTAHNLFLNQDYSNLDIVNQLMTKQSSTFFKYLMIGTYVMERFDELSLENLREPSFLIGFERP